MGYLTLVSDISQWLVKIYTDSCILDEIIRKVFHNMVIINKNDVICDECIIRVVDLKGVFKIDYTYRGEVHFDAISYDDVVFLLYHLIEYYTDTFMSMQNKIIPFHGGMVLKNNKIYPILAPTHTGKSTLIAYLCGKDFCYLSDDYIFCGENGVVYPFYLPISLRSIEPLSLNKINVVYEGYNRYKKEYIYLCDNQLMCGRSVNRAWIDKFVFIDRGNENSVIRMNCGTAYLKLLNNLKSIYTLEKDIGYLLNVAKHMECIYMCYNDMSFVYDYLSTL